MSLHAIKWRAVLQHQFQNDFSSHELPILAPLTSDITYAHPTTHYKRVKKLLRCMSHMPCSFIAS